jgi:hypothetical protein
MKLKPWPRSSCTPAAMQLDPQPAHQQLYVVASAGQTGMSSAPVHSWCANHARLFCLLPDYSEICRWTNVGLMLGDNTLSTYVQHQQ